MTMFKAGVNDMKGEIKQINICRFLAESLSEELGTFTEDNDVDPELIEGVVQVELLDFDVLLGHLNGKFEKNSDSINAIEEFKEAIDGNTEVFAYWEA